VKDRWKIIVGIVAFAAALFAARYFGFADRIRPILARSATLGPWGVAIFFGLYVAATVLLLPASILTLGAGAIYGPSRGFALVWCSATAGATAAFLVSRYLARDWIQKKLEGNARFRAVDEAVGREGWKIVGLTRLTPIFPFNLLNYAFGISRVSFRDYFLASWIGIVPGTAFYVYLGSIAGDAAGLKTGVRTPGQWGMLLMGLAAAAGVVAMITRIAKQALDRRL